MSIIENLPENIKKFVFGEETTLQNQWCLLRDEMSSGKFIKLKMDDHDYEILAPISEETINIMKGKAPKTEVHAHPLECAFRPGFRCDLCKNRYGLCLSFCCVECDFDACFQCYYDYHPQVHPNFKEIEFRESEKDFKAFIEENKNIPTMVDFNANWCGSCRQLKPLLLKEAKKNGFLLVSVNVDDNKKLTKEYDIHGIPQVNMFVDGKEVFKFTGFSMKDIGKCVEFGLSKRKWVDELVWLNDDSYDFKNLIIILLNEE